MSPTAGVVKVVVTVGRCPAVDGNGVRCRGRASEMARITTQWGSTYIKACPFHADVMEDE